MAVRRIYFCGSIRGGRNDQAIYFHLIEHLKKFGSVLTEHVASKSLSSQGEKESNFNDKQIHDRDMDWLVQSDVIVAEVTTPSLGVGYEIGRAVHLGKEILCLFRDTSQCRLSAMIQGAESDSFHVYHYKNLDEATLRIDKHFESL